MGFLRIRYLDHIYSYHISMTFPLLQANIRCENVLQMMLISLFCLKTLEYCFHPSLINFAIWNYCLIQIIKWRVMSVYRDVRTLSVSVVTIKHRTVGATTVSIITNKHTTGCATTVSIVTINHRTECATTVSVVIIKHRLVCAMRRSAVIMK